MNAQRSRAGRKRTYIVEEEVVSINKYQIEATSEEDAEDRFKEDGELVRTDIDDSSVIEAYLEEPEDEEDDEDEEEAPLHYHGREACWTNHGLGTDEENS